MEFANRMWLELNICRSSLDLNGKFISHTEQWYLPETELSLKISLDIIHLPLLFDAAISIFFARGSLK